MNVTAHIFIRLVPDTLMAREVSAEREIMATFVGHHGGFFFDICLDDWNDTGGASALDMERAHMAAVAVDKRQNRVLMAVATTLDGTFLASDKSFVRLDNTPGAAHRGQAPSAHGLTNSVRHKPSRAIGNIERAMKLVSR